MITSTLDHNPDGTERSSLAKMILFCSARAWRGNLRSVLQASAIILTIFIIFGLMPSHLDGSTLSSYKDVLSWSGKPQSQANLRIVVFGSPDVTGSAVDPEKRRTTWTEELCKQMNCTSHISMVPDSHGLASNSLYAKELSELREITDRTNITEKPALDYAFISEQYPVPHNSPDLANQVETFLATSPPEAVPHETLWVFSFGSWEIWNMAAIPRDVAEELIDSTAKHIFDQIETLYKAALDPKSVAFSDFWSNATESQVKELTDPEAIKKVDERKLESFRVVIPKLFDITVTPGWKGRPAPTFPGSVAEHTRNALWLTRYWNQAMDFNLDDWKAKGAKKPDGYEETDVEESDAKSDSDSKMKRRDDEEQNDEEKEGEEKEDADSKSSSLFNWLPASLMPKVFNQTKADNERVIFAPYPYRNGLRIDNGQMILDVITEEEMHRSNVHDSEGHGTLSRDDSRRFLDVWSPCVKASADDLTVDMDDIEIECAVPHDHLFYDPFTISHRAIVSLGKPMYDAVMDKLFVRQGKTSWFY